ncbi:MAG: hypothetical protein J6X88_00805 [Bacteroidales bacterium]|nr:hypothetical protein [Bacteroidales bacterium]
MKQNRHIYRLLPLLLTLVTCGIATAQETQWQPFAELQAGVIRSGRITMPSYSTTLGLRSDNLVLGLRYRQSDRSPLHEADPVREVSMMLQHTLQVTPRLELYGGVATGFAIEHSRMTHGKPLTFSAEVNLGVRYYVSENVALTFNVGMGSRIGANDWQALAKQLPYDPRTIPTYTTATGGVTIGIPPKVKKVNLPSQLVVAGDAPLLISYH